MLLDFAFFKEVFRDQFHMVRAGIETVSKAGHIKNLRAVQPQPEKDIAELPVFQPGHGKAGGQGGESGFHSVVRRLLGLGQMLVIVSFHIRYFRFAFCSGSHKSSSKLLM